MAQTSIEDTVGCHKNKMLMYDIKKGIQVWMCDKMPTLPVN